ncbi:MAG: hypothetical protein HYV03_06300 [Deltaproteobacteria bacterium]|nr:hypothetical protein [Deltaproteobacteria bacterium]
MRRLPPHQGRVVEVTANYGRYRLLIGPEYSMRECRRRRMPMHSRPIALEGTIDHLVIDGERVSPMPDRATVARQLVGTVVIHGVTVHLYDVIGDGEQWQGDPGHRDRLEIAETINLAGACGEGQLARWCSNGRLATETYRIIQQDILRALRAIV